MKHITSKLLSLLLCLAMLMSMVPVAYADDTESTGGENPPTETYVAKIGETGYTSLKEAINAAEDNATISLNSGEYSYTELSGASYSDKTITIQGPHEGGAVFNMPTAEKTEVAMNGANVTFEYVTFNYGNANYIGLTHANSLKYNYCTINGKAFLYANSETFNNCTFTQTAEDYNVWTYGAQNVMFNECTFNCAGKAVNVYIEANNAGSDARKVEVKSCTVNSTKEDKAFLNIKNSTQAYNVIFTGATTTQIVDSEGNKTGEMTKGLYQIESVAEESTSYKATKVSSRTNETAELETLADIKDSSETQPAYVAKVGKTSYDTLEAAFAALNAKNYTLTLLNESAWTYENVYWKAGTKSGSATTLEAALAAAYAEDAESITIICKPNATIAKSNPHIDVTGNITVYANGADFGGDDLSIGAYKAPKNSTTTINIYDARNLVVWGQPVDERADVWNVNFTDCVNDGWNFLMYRGRENGKATINATLTGCKATGFVDSIIHTTADGSITIKNCEFANNCAPVNIAHKQTGTMAVTVQNCTFENCGSTSTENKLNQYAAPARFVNSGTGMMNTEVESCTFTDTVGGNGDILIGDGRTGKTSNAVTLTVKATAANIQAQKPGYYGGETPNTSLMGEITTTVESTAIGLTTSVEKLTTATVNDGSQAHPYTLEQLGAMTRADYIAAQTRLGGTMFVTVGDYSYEKDGVLGNGKRDDTTGQVPDHSKLNAYGENGYLVERNDGANGKNIVFVGGSITSDVHGYTDIDHIDTSLLLAVPAYTNVTFKGTEFNNVMSFDYQLYTSPWSQLGELKFDGCTFKGIIVGAIAAQTLTFTGCTFENYTNTITTNPNSANNSNPIWVRPAYGNWTKGDNEGQGGDFKSLTTINFTGNKVISTRPVKFEYISQWDITSTVTAIGNYFDISAQKGDEQIKNVGLYLGAYKDENEFHLVAEKNNKSANTAALYTIPEGKTSLPVGSTVKDTAGNPVELTDALKWKAADPETDKITLKTVTAAPSGVAAIGSTGYATLAKALAAAKDGDTVTLLADTKEDVTINKNITLDLGGKTLTNTNAGKATLTVAAGATATVKNGSIVGGTGYYNIQNNGTATFEDVTATARNTGSSMIDNYGDLTINSGRYTGGLDTIKNEADAKLTITGGTFTLEKGTSKGFTGVVFNYGKLNISGGTFIQSYTSAPYGQAQVIHTDKIGSSTPSTIITGGSFTNKCTRSTAWTVRQTNAATGCTEVKGGTFNKSISEDYCADGYIPTKNADGTYGVKEGKYVAQIGNKKYETLADAIRLATKGKTVTLLADLSNIGSVSIPKNLTIDGNGHTISGNSSISVQMPGDASADVTIRNVTFKDIANGNKLSAFYFAQAKGKLTITDCTFDSIEYEALQITPAPGAVINISNNKFIAKSDGTQVRHIHVEMAYGSGFDYEGETIQLTITDNQLFGKVSGDASMGVWWVGTDSNLKLDGNFIEDPNTVSVTLSKAGVHTNAGDLIYPARSQAEVDVDNLMPVAVVLEAASGESKTHAYNTLAEAIAAAENGQTVKLLADVTLDKTLEVAKTLTLDLNGKTISNSKDIWNESTDSWSLISVRDNGNLTINDTSTEKTGALRAKKDDCFALDVYDVGCKLTINAGTYVGNSSAIYAYEGKVTINGGHFSIQQLSSSNDYRFMLNCYDESYRAGKAGFTVNGGTFEHYDPRNNAAEGPNTSFVAEGVGVDADSTNGTFTAKSGMIAQIVDANGESVKAYETLSEALSAVKAGETVKLITNVSDGGFVAVNAGTLDLNGYNLTANGIMGMPAAAIIDSTQGVGKLTASVLYIANQTNANYLPVKDSDGSYRLFEYKVSDYVFLAKDDKRNERKVDVFYFKQQFNSAAVLSKNTADGVTATITLTWDGQENPVSFTLSADSVKDMMTAKKNNTSYPYLSIVGYGAAYEKEISAVMTVSSAGVTFTTNAVVRPAPSSEAVD